MKWSKDYNYQPNSLSDGIDQFLNSWRFSFNIYIYRFHVGIVDILFLRMQEMQLIMQNHNFCKLTIFFSNNSMSLSLFVFLSSDMHLPFARCKSIFFISLTNEIILHLCTVFAAWNFFFAFSCTHKSDENKWNYLRRMDWISH